MKILIVDLTRNTHSWEAAMAEAVAASAKAEGHTVTFCQQSRNENFVDFAQQVASKAADLVVLIAHGANDRLLLDPVLDPLLQRDGVSYEVARVALTSALSAHKLLLICEGLGAASLAALNTGSRSELPIDTLAMAKKTKVSGDEAKQVTGAMFKALNGNTSRATGQQMKTAFDCARALVRGCSDWHSCEAMHVTDESEAV